MKKKTRVKGFTMVELLAVISVLAILILIAIPSFRGIYKKFSNSYYHMLEGTVKVAGNDYFTDNKKMIPELVGETSEVPVGTLIQNGYIDKGYIDKDSSGNELSNLKGKNEEETCNATYALAYKKAKGKYEYHGCLVCVDKAGKQVYSSEKNGSDEYCKAAYKMDNNMVLNVPNNGLIPLPDDINKYINRIADETTIGGLPYILPPLANSYKKQIINDLVTRNVEKHGISPNSYAVIVNGKQETEGTEVKQSNILDSVYSVYHNQTKNDKNVIASENDYKSFKTWAIKNKVKIKYTYEDEQNYTDVEGNTQQITKKATCIYSFSSMINEKVNIDLKLYYLKNKAELIANKGGKLYDGDVNIATDKGFDSIEDIDWASNKQEGVYANITDTYHNITSYVCKKSLSDQWGQCSIINNTITYVNNKENIYIAGRTAAGNYSNIKKYQVKVDAIVPKYNPKFLKKSSKWVNAEVLATNPAKYASGEYKTEDGWIREYINFYIPGFEQAGISTRGLNCKDSRNNEENKFKDFSMKKEGTTYRRIQNNGEIETTITCTVNSDVDDYKKSQQFVVKRDTKAPTGMVVNMYKWQDNSTQPTRALINTNPSSYAVYTNTTWSQLKVHTKASDATDDGVGGIHYTFKAEGATTDEDYDLTENDYDRNIEAQGTSTIKYKVCDRLNNCVESATKTIKLDWKKPDGSVTINSNNNSFNSLNTKLNFSASDATSGITSVKLNNSTEVFNDNSGSTSWSRNNYSHNLSGSYDGSKKSVNIVIKDVAGNQETITSSDYTLYKECQSSNLIADGNWYNSGSCSDACGGTQRQLKNSKDKNTGNSCSYKYENSISCGGKKSPTTTKGTCSKHCGTGKRTVTTEVWSTDGSKLCSSSSTKEDCNTKSCTWDRHIYRWKYDSSHCKYDNVVRYASGVKITGPYLRYSFMDIECSCTKNANNGNITSSYTNKSSTTHPDGYCYVIYINSADYYGKWNCDRKYKGRIKAVGEELYSKFGGSKHGIDDWSNGSNQVKIQDGWYNINLGRKTGFGTNAQDACDAFCAEGH